MTMSLLLAMPALASAQGTNGNDMGSAGAAPAGGATQYTTANYPLAYIARPLVMPKGMLEVDPSLLVLRESVPVAGPTSVATATATVEDLEVAARYGVVDKLEVALATSLFNHDSVSYMGMSSSNTQYWLSDLRAFDVQGAYVVAHTPKIDFAPAADVLFDFGDSTAQTLSEIDLDANARFMLTPKLALYTTQNAGNLVGNLFSGGHMLEFLHSTGGGWDEALNLPVMLGYQFMPKFFGGLGTTIASIGLSSGSSTNIIFKDFVELAAQARYSIDPRTDVSLLLAFPDIENQSSLFTVTGGVALRF